MRFIRRMRTPNAICVSLVVVLISGLGLQLTVILRAAHAAHGSGPTTAFASQDPNWLARKRAYLVTRPNARPGCAAVPCASYPASATLDTSVVQNTIEPPPGGPDIALRTYWDHNMRKLCGPGAATNVLYYWGAMSRHIGAGAFTDTANDVTTYWNDASNRAYLLYLAWYATAPGWPHPGMMDTHDPSYGVTLYTMRDALNWEASGEDARAWVSYFYTLTWWNQSSADTFHQQVRDDIVSAGVPVVAEVSARMLPNWSPTGNTIYHFVTIVGYDDTKGQYLYTDTCGHTTGCGSLTDGGVHAVAQSQMWAAITAIPVNTSTAYNAGDGGYVW